ncbi:V-type ATP synthase subunit F [bacterium]|nr:MAG: V-type ATP synthase subunit F [bacterium]RLJ05827.1 MAG: V-type ATP synthase subunit F [Candidatus Aenigmarchaeota archaeon]
METYKTAVVGDIATCLPFRAMGVEAVIAEETENLCEAVDRLIKSREYGAIFVAENIAERLSEIIESALYKPLPSIILIPTVTGSLGKGRNVIRETMKRAAGRDIMGEED